MKLADITLERVKAAYKKVGYEPGVGPGRCALQAIADAENIRGAEFLQPHYNCVLDYFNERDGFIRGFDGHPIGPLNDEAAYRLGREIAIALGVYQD